MKSLIGTAKRQELESDRDYLIKQQSNPLVQDQPAVMKNLRRVEHDLETQSPPDLSHPSKGAELDKVVRREKELREKIVPNMLSGEEMRKAPAGSVGKQMAFEKKFKEEILEWKNCRRTIHRDSEDPDIANLECYRPTVSRLNMHGSLIPGQDFNFPSPQFQENYDQIDWNAHKSLPGEEVETFKSRVRREKIAALMAAAEALESEDTPVAENTAEAAPPQLGLEE